MLKSMTGYGQAVFEDDQYRVQVEVKTLNAKQAEVTLRCPSVFTAQEIPWRNLAISHLVRGKMLLAIDYEPRQAATPPISIDQALFKTYYKTLQTLANEVGAPTTALFPLAWNAPAVLQRADAALPTEEDIHRIELTVRAALQQCDQVRSQEGIVLARHIDTYLQHIKQGLTCIEKIAPISREAIKDKLIAKVMALQDVQPVDKNRLAQELLYYTERLGITEEVVRLAQHLSYFEETMQRNQPVGKKLSFIAQEMGREINTIGAKAQDAAIQKQVVLMKDELEKIKEQLQNIL
ncbi:MAG: YicC/YloC family endoribonuclease [Bacteroidota bacterium]